MRWQKSERLSSCKFTILFILNTPCYTHFNVLRKGMDSGPGESEANGIKAENYGTHVGHASLSQPFTDILIYDFLHVVNFSHPDPIIS